MDKPITILRQEFISSIVELINASGLPAFVIADVLGGLLSTVRQQEKMQLEEDRRSYEASRETAAPDNKSPP